LYDTKQKDEVLTTPLSPQHSDMAVIDFSKLSKGNKDEVLTELFNVATGCEEWGIFQLNIYIVFGS